MKTPRTGSSQPGSSSQAAKRLKGKDIWCDDELRRCLSEYSYERESSDDELPCPEDDKYDSDTQDKDRDSDVQDKDYEIACRFGSRDGRRAIARVFCELTDDIRPVALCCIWPGTAIGLSDAKFFEIPWVAVRGIDTICVVTRNKDLVRLDRQHSKQSLDREYFRLCFWNTLISFVEECAAPFGESCQMSSKSSEKPFGVGPCDESSDEPCQMLHKSSKKPFGVFALIGGSNKVHEVSGTHSGEKTAMKFLQWQMAKDISFTFDKTIQTAMAAFQYLFCQNFEADELRAFVLKNDESLGRELKQERERIGIEEVIPFINEA